MSTSTQFLFALTAQAKDWHIFPCAPLDKRGAWAVPDRYRIKWYEYASNDLNQIMMWWTQDPEYNIGISCKKSNLLVVDCDVPKEGEPAVEDGADQFRKLVESGGHDWEATIDTYQVETPSKGLHLYYNWPEDVKASQASLDSLLDVRTNGGDKGGYVVGAGSVITGGIYHCPNPAPVQDCPRWLVEKVRSRTPKWNPGTPLSRRRPRVPGKRMVDDPFEKPFHNYQDLHDELLSAPEGMRNDTLNSVCIRAAKYMPTYEALLREFYDDAEKIGLTDQEIPRTIHSAWKAAHGTS